jgi:hypothetical protein
MPTLNRRWSLVIALVLLASPGAGWAAELPEKPPATPSLTHVIRQRWVQFTLNSGRIAVTGSRGVNYNPGGQIRNHRGEQLTIRITSHEPVMNYELQTPTYRFLLDVSAGKRLELRRLPQPDRSEPVPVEFREGPSGPLVLTVGPKDAQRVYQAESLWHLFLADRSVSRQHLAPLLKIILPESDFVKTADEIEAILVRTAQNGAPPDQTLWNQWVRQLGDTDFAKREQADRKLRESGRVVATFLGQLDPSRLDAEQRFRVRRIVHAMSNLSDEESPPQIAAWLSGDPGIWLALPSREPEPICRVILKRLEAMVGGPLTFDPAADEQTRQRQIETIRTKIGKRDES